MFFSSIFPLFPNNNFQFSYITSLLKYHKVSMILQLTFVQEIKITKIEDITPRWRGIFLSQESKHQWKRMIKTIKWSLLLIFLDLSRKVECPIFLVISTGIEFVNFFVSFFFFSPFLWLYFTILSMLNIVVSYTVSIS